jgi:hypothetical protein
MAVWSPYAIRELWWRFVRLLQYTAVDVDLNEKSVRIIGRLYVKV